MKLALALAYLASGLVTATLAYLIGTIGYPISCAILGLISLAVCGYMAHFTLTH